VGKCQLLARPAPHTNTPEDNTMIVIKDTQAKVLTVLQSVAGIVSGATPCPFWPTS